jgi:hypothetical protein
MLDECLMKEKKKAAAASAGNDGGSHREWTVPPNWNAINYHYY